MKKILLIAIIAIISVSAANAQLLEYFTAKDGAAFALQEVQADGLTDPELLMVGTLMASYDVEVLGTISTEFQVDDGTANVWTYMFREKDNSENIVAMAVAKVFILGYVSFPIPLEDLAGIPVDPGYPIPANWLDSDAFSSKLKEDDNFLTYYYSASDPDNWVIGLYVNTTIPFIEIGQPYWGIVIYDGGTEYACSMHATTQDFECTGVVTVEEKQIVEVIAYPNPAVDQLNVTLPEDIKRNHFQVKIVDILGNTIQVMDQNFVSNTLTLSVDNLNTGTYLIEIVSDEYIYTGKFTIAK
jgi:hypothetical protein